MAMAPSTVLRISSVDALYQAIEDASDMAAQEAVVSSSDFDSSGGCALLGTLRVASQAEKYARAPFRLPAGSLVFADSFTRDTGSQPLQRREIRCQASMPRMSWFAPTVKVLLTHWRYIAQPTALRGVEAAAWAYIEILSAPVLLSEDFQLPRMGRPLSWWTKHQVHPELSEEQELFNAIKESPPLSCVKAAKLLDQQQPSASQLLDDTSPELCAATQHQKEGSSLNSVMGRVRAVSAIFSSEGEPAYAISLVVETATPSGCEPTLVPVYMHGQRFLGLHVSLSADESLFVTGLKTTMVRDGPDRSIAALVTSPTSKAFRIEEFDGLDESLIYVPPATQTHFTQNSQDSLLSQITSHSTAATTSGLQDGTSPSTGSNANKDQSAAPQVVTTVDRHLVICKDRLECYEGEITRIIDAALGIYVVDDTHLLMLTFWPKFSPLFVLRPGTRVVLDNMHVFMLVDTNVYQWSWIKRAWPDMRDEQTKERRVLVFGACAYGAIRVVKFPETPQPAEFPLLLFSGLSSMVVERAHGLVQMIEILESFWKLCIKFPSGPQTVGARADNSARDIAQQNMQMALELVGSKPEKPENCPSVCWIVSSHHCTCDIDTLTPDRMTRVIALRNIVRWFKDWRERPSAQLNTDAAMQGTEGAKLTIALPKELDLEGFPLIGQLSVNKRGCLYLRDGTGELRVRPRADFGGCNTDMLQPIFPGQSVVGHVCTWRAWHFAVETVELAPTAIDSSNSAADTPQFSLAYAQLLDPQVIHVDNTFGSQSTSQDSGGNMDTTSRECFLFCVHTQGPVIPQPVIPSSPSGSDAESTVATWEAVVVVKGVLLRLSSDAVHAQLHGDNNKGYDDGDAVLDLGRVEERDLQPLHLLCNLDRTPVCFTSGSAYIICIGDAARVRICDASLSSASRSGQVDVVVCELEPVDHIHPVAVNGEVTNGDSAYGSTADDGIQAIVPYMTTVRLEPASDNVWKHMQTLPAFSVCDLFKCIAVASTPESSEALLSDTRCVPNAIISIHGIILRREVKKSIMFSTADRNQGEDNKMQPAVGQLENHITLQDEKDSTKAVVVYVKLTTFSHPLGLVPGAHVVFRDVIFNVSKSTGNPYLSGTHATSAEEIVANSTARRLIQKDIGSEGAGEPTTVCIGQLYTMGHSSLHGRLLRLHCYVNSVENLKLALVCETCQNTVCNMSCACAQKRHRMVPKRRAGSDELRPATVRASVEMLCIVSDGSGIAWVAATRESDVVGMLGLSAAELEQLYEEAAQSWNGQLLWKPQQAANGQPSDASSVLSRAAASASGVSILVEGTTESRLTVKRQPLRMDGQNVSVNKHMMSTIKATRVARPAAVDLCWSLLNKL
ncbi:hypothetical protein H4R20_000765 [Coemansia guatemalensis]|uniref:CST complex subunit CTC1 n=1 Tax=Coemansia guatemalensis TaxID=2761395 RepID=A0A9W8I4L3_9FUNG|nr:hypothetical protein H4R20_000765 [Coemansia guatemalensis]